MKMTPKEIYNLHSVGEWSTAGDDVQYKFYIDHQDKRIYLVYQCSMSKKDWINNFKFLTKSIYINSQKVKCHRGFLDAFISAYKTIFTELNFYMQQYKNYSVVHTGHSFGGAMSLLSGIFFHREYGIKADIVNFGSPKVIRRKKDLKLVKSVCINSMQCWGCNNDMITYMPPHYTRLGHIRINDKFNLYKVLFKSEHYHTCYGDEDIDYPDTND